MLKAFLPGQMHGCSCHYCCHSHGGHRWGLLGRHGRRWKGGMSSEAIAAEGVAQCIAISANAYVDATRIANAGAIITTGASRVICNVFMTDTACAKAGSEGTAEGNARGNATTAERRAIKPTCVMPWRDRQHPLPHKQHQVQLHSPSYRPWSQPTPCPMLSLRGGVFGWPRKRPLTRAMATQSGAYLEVTQDTQAPSFTRNWLSRNQTQSSARRPPRRSHRRAICQRGTGLAVGRAKCPRRRRSRTKH
jgi:hypothetical protein